MANIANLNVQLTASTKGFISAMERAGDSVQRFSKKSNTSLSRFNASIGGLSRGISRLGGPLSMGVMKLGNVAASAFKGIAFGATAAATALGYMSLSMIEAIGDSADMAKRLGISYNALKTFQYAAKLAGVDAEALNTAFERMQDVLGSASMGNSAAIDSLARIGLSMEQLNSMRPEKRFEAIANAINRIQDPAQRIAAARDIFGKQGGALLVLFENAGEAIRRAADQMDRLGVSLSAIEVSKAEEAGDAMDNFKTALEGVATQLAIEISPYLSQAWKDTEAWIESMGGIDDVVDKSLNKLERQLGKIADMTDWLVVSWEKLSKVFSIASKLIDGGRPSGTAAVRGIKEWIAMDVEERQAERGKPSGKMADWARRAREESDAEYQAGAPERFNEESLDKNRDAVEAAKQRRQQEMWQSYVSKFGDPAAEQQRAAEIMERARARGVIPSGPLAQANRTPFVGQSAQGGGMGEQVMLLRQIASNTGKPTLAYAG